MPFDLDRWKRWEGESVDSAYWLERCIGGSSRSAVFETQYDGNPAAIKLIPGTPEEIANLRNLWKKSAGLAHPAIVKTFAAGETVLGDMECAYIVMERADENLAEALTERESLTPSETRELLVSLLGVLGYLASNGFVHGRLKPANVMAFGDQVKISSDSLVEGRDADCHALGDLIKDALGGGTHPKLPRPFAEIVRHCLTPDPAARWKIADIENCLLGNAAPVRFKSRIIGWGVAAAALVLGMIALSPLRHNRRSESPATQNQVPRQPPENAFPPALAPITTTPPEVNRRGKTSAAGIENAKSPSPEEKALNSPPVHNPNPVAEQNVADLDGIDQAQAEIPAQALRTITGRIRINIRVRVDSAGNVSEATLESPGRSKYFGSRLLTAAKKWHFPPGNAPQDWMLHYELRRDGVRVSIAKIVN